MRRETLVGEQLKGWSNIAKYMGQSTSTVQQWAKSGMPVSREGRSVVASPEALRDWLGHESGHKGTQIVTDDTDLSAVLKSGLKDARADRQAQPAKRAGERQPRVQTPPAPKPQVPRYFPVLPLSQVESRIAGLEKRLQQLTEVLESVDGSEKRKVNSEIKAVNSVISHYRSGLEIERSLQGQATET
jgi:hypothetical protein